ncbi:MAG: hypothetical protein Q7R98_03525 [Candidatus Jorgensenbacteria bacterium]|nr:hypothetical protein [Candidatus Jorgensenbacteria bacterium]
MPPFETPQIRRTEENAHETRGARIGGGPAVNEQNSPLMKELEKRTELVNELKSNQGKLLKLENTLKTPPAGVDLGDVRDLIKKIKSRQIEIVGEVKKIGSKPEVMEWEKQYEEKKKKAKEYIRTTKEKLCLRARDIAEIIKNLADRKHELEREVKIREKEHKKAWENIKSLIKGHEELVNAKSGAEIIKLLEEKRKDTKFFEIFDKTAIDKLLSEKRGWLQLVDEQDETLKQLGSKLQVVELNISKTSKLYSELVKEAEGTTEIIKKQAEEFHLEEPDFKLDVSLELERKMEGFASVRSMEDANNEQRARYKTWEEALEGNPELKTLRDVWRSVDEEAAI